MTRARRSHWLAVLLMFGCASAMSTEPAANAIAPDAPVELEVELLDGRKFDLAAQRGHWVVVNFWATWCSPCLKEMPDLDALDRAREDVAVLGLAFEEIEAADLRQFLAGRPVSYPIARVDVYAPPAAFEVPRGLPTTYLLAPDGRIAQRFLGPVTSAQLERAIAGGAKAPAQ